MKLEELLNYRDIVIQCHDKPDADAIASGFALLKYKVTPELYLMIGVDGETYHNDEDKLHRNYDLLEEPFLIDDKSPWQPKVHRYSDREARLLAPYAKTCVAKDGAQIWAAQLNCRVEVLTTWGEWHLGEAGDWLVSRDDDRQDIYIIQETVFGRTYEMA